MVIIYILGVIIFFYALRRHTIKKTDWALEKEVSPLIFCIGLFPGINLLFGIFLALQFIKFKKDREWHEIILFIYPKKDDSK